MDWPLCMTHTLKNPRIAPYPSIHPLSIYLVQGFGRAWSPIQEYMLDGMLVSQSCNLLTLVGKVGEWRQQSGGGLLALAARTQPRSIRVSLRLPAPSSVNENSAFMSSIF